MEPPKHVVLLSCGGILPEFQGACGDRFFQQFLESCEAYANRLRLKISVLIHTTESTLSIVDGARKPKHRQLFPVDQ